MLKELLGVLFLEAARVLPPASPVLPYKPLRKVPLFWGHPVQSLTQSHQAGRLGCDQEAGAGSQGGTRAFGNLVFPRDLVF